MENDICANKHGGNPESAAAFGKGRKSQRQAVLRHITAAGEVGYTCDELAAKWNVGCNDISGRFTELKKRSLIMRSGKRKTRSGNFAGVYIANNLTTPILCGTIE